MHGKVVHLVERPPPGPNGPDPSSADHPQANNANNATITISRPPRVILRRDPNGEQAQPRGGSAGGGPSLNLSSTLCLNRITVARHMLQCASNIINHMDNPQVPLDNAPMDLLVQETLDTTVVEVGISAISDVDQVQDIMQAFRGAVNAAFRPGGGQVGGSATGGNAADGESDGGADLNSSTASSSSSASSLSSTFDANDSVVTGGVTATDPLATNTTTADPAGEDLSGSGQADGTPASTTAAPTTDGEATTGDAGATGTASGSARTAGGQQQTTSPRVLGEVVEEMRNVQRRLEPHMQRYYDILMNEPTYGTETQVSYID